jgi:hypothetical protein
VDGEGSVLVWGEGTFTYTDASVGKLGDVAFGVGAGDSTAQSAPPVDELIDGDQSVDHLLPAVDGHSDADRPLIAMDDQAHLSDSPSMQIDAGAPGGEPVADANADALAATPPPPPPDDVKVVEVPENVAPVDEVQHALA